MLVLGQSNSLQHRDNAAPCVLTLNATKLQRHLHVLVNGEAIEKVVGLENIANLSPGTDQDLLAGIEELAAQYFDAAFLRRPQRAD
jgi:hypothetical protein